MQLSRYLGLVFAVALTGCAVDAASEGEERELQESSESAATTSTGTGNPSATTPGLKLSAHTTLGFPEAATPEDPVHALIVKRQYVTSYDSERKNPRWTSWELTSSWLGSAQRSNNWKLDRDLPSSIPQASNSDYTNSGYQRGHIVPSADRTKSDTDNQATFLFTNVVPQTAESNTATWESLEREERNLAASNHVFIVAGSIYTDNRTIGDGVAIPSSMFKIVVVMRGAHPLPSEVTTSTRVLTVEIPNTHTVSGDYKRYRTSLQAIEAKTGFHFLSDVPAAVHDALATQVDAQ